MTSLRWLTFPTWIPQFDSHSPALLDFFLSSDPSISSTMVFLPLGKSDHVVVSVSIDFPSNSKRGAPLHRIAYGYSCQGVHASWKSWKCPGIYFSRGICPGNFPKCPGILF